MPIPPRRLSLAAACLAVASCTAGHRITRFEPPPPGRSIADAERAAYYALPRTLLQVTFKAKKVVVEDKECFAEVLGVAPGWTGAPTGSTVAEALGLSPIPKAKKTLYAIDGAPELTVLAEPDPAQVFRADLDSSWLVKRRLELALGPLGVLQSGISLAKDRSADWLVGLGQVAGQTLKTFSRGGEDLFPIGDPAAEPETDCAEVAEQLKGAVEALQGLESAVDQGRLDRVTASWLGERYRNRLGQIFGQLSAREEVSATIVCLVEPVKERTDYPVLELAKTTGFREAAPRGCSIPGELQAPSPFTATARFDLSVRRNEEQLVEVYESAGLGGLPKSNDPQGFYYRIPAVARVVATRAEGASCSQLFSRDVVVAQLGIVAALPRQSAIESQYEVSLDPLTGALVKLVASSEAADPKLLTDLGATIEKEKKAAADAEKAAAAATDELALLERERKLLEERQKIRELKAKLGEEAP